MNMRDRPGGPTRWEELRQTVMAMVEFAAYFDQDGTDLHFLNRPAVMGVREPEDPRLGQCFQSNPAGTTPLTERVEEILNSGEYGARPVLMVIATDGEPNGGSGNFKRKIREFIHSSDYNVPFRSWPAPMTLSQSAGLTPLMMNSKRSMSVTT